MTQELFFLYCSTGCSCCNEENHYRGPYKTEEDAERRANYWLTGGESPPVASRYARNGRYTVEKVTVEQISDDRVIVNDSRVFPASYLEPIEIDADGSTTEADWFSDSDII